jgi:hypothetical protein
VTLGELLKPSRASVSSTINGDKISAANRLQIFYAESSSTVLVMAYFLVPFCLLDLSNKLVNSYGIAISFNWI